MSHPFDRERTARTTESGHGPYGQIVSIRRHIFALDEPESLGGADTGPDPMELLASSLAACTAMTLRMYAQRRKIELGKITVDVSHQWVKGEDGGRADRFVKTISIDPPPSAEILEKLQDIASRCPVHLALTSQPQLDTIWA